MHLDEATPHLHIDFVPVCYNQNQGLKTRVSMKRAIQQMLGVTTDKKKECEAVLWCNAERDVMTKILNAHQIKRQIVSAYHEHLPLKEYRQHAQNIKVMNQKIKTLTEQNPDDLSQEEIGEIINQNRLLRESLDHQQQELNKYKTQALSDFVPIEIYNDDKRQYLISILQRQRTPFVEEDHALYVQECYAASVKKLASEYKVNDNPTMREKLKFTLYRLIYTAVNFENMLELLEQMGHGVKRGKYTAIKPPYSQRFMRLRSLGEGYSEFELKKRIERRNEIPDEFNQSEKYYANDLQKPFYGAINSIITLVRTFAFTPAKNDTNKAYSFTNDKTIDRLCCCLGTLSEFNINSREELYKAAENLQERIDNSNDECDELKKQQARISSVIRTYEEIIEGNYIDNLIRAEKEHKDAVKLTEEHKTGQNNRKPKKFGIH
ncbi:MAG: plasmid recombination protein [Oscillospiraceae bacterium]|nr:plasmid recombination protein [Oscillospiraceae bacterium]